MRAQKPRGQGIIELIIAIGIIMASVVTTLGLVIATTTTSSASKAQILAANLAREGVEVVRSVRDGNWLAMDSGSPGAAWNADLSLGSDYTAIAEFQPPGSLWALLFNEDSVGQDGTEIYFNPASGVYTQLENAEVITACPGGAFCNFKKINYWRLISLNPVCWYKDPATGLESPTPVKPEQIAVEGSQCSAFGADYAQVGVEVRSRVRWLEKGKPHNTEIADKLFNWKT